MTGPVFFNRFGKPYQDSGGHWALHCVMADINLITIKHMGGWKSLRMVQRYAGVGTDHMRAAINKLD